MEHQFMAIVLLFATVAVVMVLCYKK